MRVLLVVVVALALVNAALADSRVGRRVNRLSLDLSGRTRNPACGKGDASKDPAGQGAGVNAASCTALGTAFAKCAGADRAKAESADHCEGWDGKAWNHNANEKGKATKEAALTAKRAVLGTKEEINCYCDVDESAGCAHKNLWRLNMANWSECANLHFIYCIMHGKLPGGNDGMEFALDPKHVGEKRFVTRNEVCYLSAKCKEDVFSASKGHWKCTPK